MNRRCTLINLYLDYFSLGNACYKTKDYQGAFLNYDRVLQLNPNLAEAYFYRANSRYYLFGNIYKALEDCNYAITINPVNSKFYLVRGYFLIKIGENYNAIQDLNKSIKINENYELAYIIRGNLHSKISNIEGAIEDYSQAILINPKNIKAYCKRGCLFYKQGKKKDAIKDFDLVINLNPSYATAYYNRSIANYEIGKTTDAKKDYEQAISMNSKLPKLNYFLLKEYNIEHQYLEHINNVYDEDDSFEEFDEYQNEYDFYTRNNNERSYDTFIDYGYLNDMEEYNYLDDSEEW